MLSLSLYLLRTVFETGSKCKISFISPGKIVLTFYCAVMCLWSPDASKKYIWKNKKYFSM